MLGIVSQAHRMDKSKSFVFARQYRNCFPRSIDDYAKDGGPGEV